MRDPYPLEKGVEFLILTTPVRLHVKYFAIKLPFDKSLKVEKDLENIGAFLKEVYPSILAKVIDETHVIGVPTNRGRGQSPYIRKYKLQGFC